MLTDKKYLFLLAAHALLGFLVFLFRPFSVVYGVVVLCFGCYYIIKNRNANDEVLLVSGYIIGAEVFLRMTEGNFIHEYGKYCMALILVIGFYYKGFSKNAIPYWIFLLLLVPGLIVATQTLGPGIEMRKTLSFNLSGPVCLALASIYCYRREITQEFMYMILLCVGLPIISMAVYLNFYTPDIRSAITGTASNLATSGGFGPNQVATLLGLGMFIFFVRLILSSKSTLLMLVNLFIVLLITFRGLVTFSRGGMITGVLMIAVLVFFLLRRLNSSGRSKLNFAMIFFAMALVGIWMYSSLQTGGLLENRYANEDSTGRKKESLMTGREEILSTEIDDFLENPVFGVGVARAAQLRYEKTGDFAASHNELTRMLGEHGAFGVLALLLLLITPMVLYLDNKLNFFIPCFLIFWILTINHAAMRTASPSFIYALSVLQIIPKRNERNTVHRE